MKGAGARGKESRSTKSSGENNYVWTRLERPGKLIGGHARAKRHPVLDHYDLIKKGDTWVFEKRGSYRPLLTEATKADALKKMNEYMRTRDGSVRVYSDSGEVEEEWTY